MKEGLEMNMMFRKAKALEQVAPDKMERAGRRETERIQKN